MIFLTIIILLLGVSILYTLEEIRNEIRKTNKILEDK